jgi:hypothetical protein
MTFDAIHLVGYLGALGSLVFGGNQLRVILQHHSAKDVGVFDYGIRVAYSVLLGIYAIGTGDLVFMVVNFGAAILSAAVAAAAFFMKQHNEGGEEGEDKGGRRKPAVPATTMPRSDARRSSSRRTDRSGTATARQG